MKHAVILEGNTKKDLLVYHKSKKKAEVAEYYRGNE